MQIDRCNNTVNLQSKSYDHINVDKASDKIQHPLMIKTFNKMGTEVPHIIKTSSDKPSANIVNDRKLTVSLLR